jgi:hypothetical protein
MSLDRNRPILTGENPFIQLSADDAGPSSTVATFWRIIYCPIGLGHALYLKSELTGGDWRIYSDNAAVARWLQETVQGMIIEELQDLSIAIIDARFSTSGDLNSSWTEHVSAADSEVMLTWYDIGEPVLNHTQPNEPTNPRPYGVCSLLFPALGAQLTVDGQPAEGQAWRREREERPFSTCALAFAESWTEPR